MWLRSVYAFDCLNIPSFTCPLLLFQYLIDVFLGCDLEPNKQTIECQKLTYIKVIYMNALF